MGQQFLDISHMGIKAGHQSAPALFCLQGSCISIHAFKCWFLFGWANTKQPPTHHALVILQPFQAHRPVQPHKMGGLQLPAAYQSQTVMFLDDRSEKTSIQRRKYESMYFMLVTSYMNNCYKLCGTLVTIIAVSTAQN